MKQKSISCFTAMLMALSLLPASMGALTVTAADQQQTGTKDGYDWELWNQYGQGSVSMQTGSNGAFSCSWSNIENCLFRSGKKLGSTKSWSDYGGIQIDYNVDYKPDGNSYMCIYGWTEDPTVEYYIVEAWGTWRPPGQQGGKGTVSSDGKSYDIYTSTRMNQPSIHGTETFEQYWSVNKTNPATAYQQVNLQGTITVSNHFSQWEKSGMKMGRMYEVALNIEGYQSNGSANVKSNTLKMGNIDTSSTQTGNNSQQGGADMGGQGGFDMGNFDWSQFGGGDMGGQQGGFDMGNFDWSQMGGDMGGQQGGFDMGNFDWSQFGGGDMGGQQGGFDMGNFDWSQMGSDMGNFDWSQTSWDTGAQQGGVITTTTDTPTFGDLNLDGVVDLTDLTTLSIYLMGGKTLDTKALANADVQYDGEVDIADLATLKQYVSKDSSVVLGKGYTAPQGGAQQGGFDMGNFDWSQMGGDMGGQQGGFDMGNFDWSQMGGGDMDGQQGGFDMGSFDWSQFGGGDMGGQQGGFDMGNFDWSQFGGMDMGGQQGGFDMGGQQQQQQTNTSTSNGGVVKINNKVVNGVLTSTCDTSWIPAGSKVTAISFDDGPFAGNQNPGRIQNALTKNGFHATFFYWGEHISGGEQEIKNAYNAGFEVANHTWTHPYLTQQGDHGASEVNKTRDALNRVLGVENDYSVRAPYLSIDQGVLSACNVPFPNCGIDTQDWNNASKDSIVNTIKSNMGSGNLANKVVLCHENYDTTAGAMEEVFPYMKSNGWVNVAVIEMFKYNNKEMRCGTKYDGC